jgi:hypothetical protein
MASLVDRGFALLNRAMEPAAATTVRYTRNATVISDALPAALSAPQIEQITDSGAAVIGRQFTWRLKRSELVVDGVATKPQKFDRIEWTLADMTYVFEVLPETGVPESGAVDPRNDWIPASAKLIESNEQ